MKFLIALIATLAVANGQIVISGTCKDVKLQKEFNVPMYTGNWSEIFRYEHTNQLGGDCVTATYGLTDEGIVTVLNAMVIKTTKYQIKGTVAVAPDANGEGKLIVSFPTTMNTNSDYWVLSTDYDSYSLVYACADLPNNNRRVSSWILSRTTTLSNSAVLAMTPVIEATDGLNWDNYRQTSQSEASCTFNDIIEI